MIQAEMSKLPDLGSNSSLACRALPALAPAPQNRPNEKSSGSGSVVVKSKKSSGKLELWFTNYKRKQFPNFINHNFVTTTKNKKKTRLFNCHYRFLKLNHNRNYYIKSKQKTKTRLQLEPGLSSFASSGSGSPKKTKCKKLWLWLPPKRKSKKAPALASPKRQNQKSSALAPEKN